MGTIKSYGSITSHEHEGMGPCSCPIPLFSSDHDFDMEP